MHNSRHIINGCLIGFGLGIFSFNMEGLRDVKAGTGIAEVNRAVIVSVRKFDYGVDMDRRPGTKADTKRLHRILSKLGFQVTIAEEDLSADEIYQVFREGKSDLIVLNVQYSMHKGVTDPYAASVCFTSKPI